MEWHWIGGTAVIVGGVILSFCVFYLFAVKRRINKCEESVVGAMTKGVMAFIFIFFLSVTLGVMMMIGTLPFIFR